MDMSMDHGSIAIAIANKLNSRLFIFVVSSCPVAWPRTWPARWKLVHGSLMTQIAMLCQSVYIHIHIHIHTDIYTNKNKYGFYIFPVYMLPTCYHSYSGLHPLR
jgi:hypothetical protein